jgi:hypothetical protein
MAGAFACLELGRSPNRPRKQAACDTIPDVPTVVVVQSDELSAWIGIAGVAVGVFLTAGVDSLRKRASDRDKRQGILVDYAGDVRMAGVSLAEARIAAGDNASQQPWAEMIATRKDALAVVHMTAIRAIGSRTGLMATRHAERAMALTDAATVLWAVWDTHPGQALPAAEIIVEHWPAAVKEWFRLLERYMATAG